MTKRAAFFKNAISSIVKTSLLLFARINKLLRRKQSVLPEKQAGSHRRNTWRTKKQVAIMIGAAVIILAVVLPIVLSAPKVVEAFPDSEIAYAAGANVSKSIGTEVPLPDEDTAVANMQNTMLASGDTTVPSSTSQTTPVTTPDDPVPTTEPEVVELYRGCHDPRVLGIQEKLMALGYMAYDEPTDYYGYTTWYSVQLFQRKHDLSIDGIAGDLTLQLLFSDEAKPYTVKLEDTGSDVKEFQDRLKSLNYLKTSSTSYFGTDTEKAVISFQKRNGLSPDGIIGENTLELLYSDSAKEAATSSSSGGGSSGGSTTHASVYIEGDPTPEALIKYAKTKLGCNYSLGAKGPSSFDCSGFVYYCLNQIGYKIKYMTSTGWTNCDLKKISKMKDMKAGDIICFTPHHVGIYMGNGRMIDASSGNDEVVIRDNIFNSSYWTSHFVCARRIF